MPTRRQLILAAFARAGSDSAILRRAIEMELEMALAYEAMGDELREAGHFERDARAHAESLTASLKRLGGTPPPEPRSAGQAPGDAGFALRLELTAVMAYHDALGRLRNPAVLRRVSSIVANHGQHLVVLREALGREPLPTAFETGRIP
jgi:Ferritin-like domain